MHHSDVDYWRDLQAKQLLDPTHPDVPSPRICRLLLRTFERWKGRSGWLAEAQVGHLFRGRSDLTEAQRADLAVQPIAIRKGLAVARMLELIQQPNVAASADSFRVSPDELLVGVLPPFAVGQGKEFVRYLTEEEELAGALRCLNELSPMGHIVPDHGVVLNRGLEAMKAEADAGAASTSPGSDPHNFYRSVSICLQAVMDYADSYAARARAMAGALPAGDPGRANLEAVADALAVAPRKPAETFHQALQAILIVHCALHWTVEIVPIGRLDQLLAPLHAADVEAGRLTPEGAQELIDCFWIKLDERVILDNRHAENRFTAFDGVLTGFEGTSNYDQGALLNQWMQQVTIGGMLPDDAGTPTDACNPVTRLCLEAARRLPLNSPTLDLRVHSQTPEDVLDLAARALLSGGAHPVLLNDDVIVPALASASGPEIPLADARDYACDGCYETMVAGQSEFSFGFVFALNLIEKAMNRGAMLGGAGPINLRGTKDSWRSPAAADIPDMETFRAILIEHMRLDCHRYLNNLIRLYGNKHDIAPSPLLSALIRGCLETGRDITQGGARYHIFSPLLVGVSNAANSLHVIETLVFEQKAFSLQELTTCLATNWGERMLDRGGRQVPAFGPGVAPERIKAIHALCVDQAKFGTGQASVDHQAWWLLETFTACVREVAGTPVNEERIRRLSQAYDHPAQPFRLNLAPGTGTFEQYVGLGGASGASADGRPANSPIASDCSPAPDYRIALPEPGEPFASQVNAGKLEDSLASYRHAVMAQLGDGAPVDYNIPEDFDPDRLRAMLRRFANGEGGSICTFTVCDPETFSKARKDPERYNLVRVRMGGWTEFFVALFPDHQAQHMRRPLYV